MSNEMDNVPLFFEENREEEEEVEVGVDDDINNKNDDDEEELEEDVYSCKYCTFSTPNLDDLDEHIVSHDEAVLDDKDEEFEDEDTMAENSVSSEFNISTQTKRSVNFRSTNDGGRITKKGFQRFPAFFHEMKNQPVKKVFVCPYCGYQSMKKLDMNGHLKKHNSPVDITIYACSECNYTTRRKCDMPKHLLSHCKDGSVPMYKCDYCPYATKRKGDLAKHILCHVKTEPAEKEYVCLQCEYTTKRKGDLKKHIVTHDLDCRQYNCTECGYAARRLNDLHKHVILHRDKTFNGLLKCLKCDFCTTRNLDYAKHVLNRCHTVSNDGQALSSGTQSGQDYVVLEDGDLPLYELEENDMTIEVVPRTGEEIRRSVRKRMRLNDDDFIDEQGLDSYFVEHTELLCRVGQERNSKVIVLDENQGQ